ncbi:hypothetical protein MIR68_003549 [Amoeboaphelidium protococcarum]|nr:hypothetical protein MIR68_003549 [Amoeboaphelidium protococcarum]
MLRVCKRFNSGLTTAPAQSAKLLGKAPQFQTVSVWNKEFKLVKLDDFKGKWVLLFTYPMDFTFTCPTEILSFSKNYDEFQKNNCQVLGSSVDSQFTHLAWINTPQDKGGLGQDLKVPLLADVNRDIATKYGCLLDNGVCSRATYLIDPQQRIRHISQNDLPVGRNVKEYLRLLQAFQFADEHGEVCPSDWQVGHDTIKPDPKGSLEYFKKAANKQ